MRKGFYKFILGTVIAIFVIISVIAFIALPVVLKNGLGNVSIKAFSTMLTTGFLSKAQPDGWAGFFGSYLGGVATLIAVIVTILYNFNEIKRKSIEEKEERIKKSALIIYFDFKFILENIYTFLDELRDNKVGTDVLDPCDNYDFEKYKEKRVVLDQFYFDSNWIRTVADLYESENSNTHNIDPNEIKTIYEIYGHFMTIEKSTYSYNEKICNKAFEAMKKIKAKNSEVEKIMSKLRVIAEMPEDTAS